MIIVRGRRLYLSMRLWYEPTSLTIPLILGDDSWDGIEEQHNFLRLFSVQRAQYSSPRMLPLIDDWKWHQVAQEPVTLSLVLMRQVSVVSATMFSLWRLSKHLQHAHQGLSSFKVLIGSWNLETNYWTILQYFRARLRPRSSFGPSQHRLSPIERFNTSTLAFIPEYFLPGRNCLTAIVDMERPMSKTSNTLQIALSS